MPKKHVPEIHDSQSLSNEAKSHIVKFQQVLKQMFHMDGADDIGLDFGIYRIIKIKMGVIKRDVIDAVPGMVSDVVRGYAEHSHKDALEALKSISNRIKSDYGKDALNSKGQLSADLANKPIGKEYNEAKNAAGHALRAKKMDVDIFNHLLQFFSRYYEGGDFMPRRRSTRHGTYTLPYGGEDVVLHWASRGQYYVKTSDRFLAYEFPLKECNVKFVVKGANELPPDNNEGGDMFFFPMIEDARMCKKQRTLTIPFEYRSIHKSDDYLQGENAKKPQGAIFATANKTAKRILPSVIKGKKDVNILFAEEADSEGNNISLFLRHLDKYCRGNDSDFFIHKNLSGFLRRELDSYIKSDVFNLDELTDYDKFASDAQYVTARAVRDIGRKIIVPLADIEDFQRHLWEKKKFITRTNYIVRLGAIDENAVLPLMERITDCHEQWLEWVSLGIIGKGECKSLGINGDAKSTFAGGKRYLSARKQFVSQNPSLPLDTACFNEEFRDDVVGTFDDVESAIDGICFHGDNWQVLNLISEKYKGRVKCIYIDPPYNTKQSKIVYKNNYEHSSWLSLLSDRYEIAKRLMSQDTIIMTAIDDYELSRLCELIDASFDGAKRHIVVVNHHAQGAGMGGAALSRTHEYMVVVSLKQAAQLKGDTRSDPNEIRSYRRAGSDKGNFRGEYSNSFHAILVDAENNVVGLEEPPMGKKYPREKTREGYRRIYPIGEDGSERVWRHAHATTKKVAQEGRLICTPKGVIKYKVPHGENSRGALMSNWSESENDRFVHGSCLLADLFGHDENDHQCSNWTDKKFGAGIHGTNLIQNMFGQAGLFSYPKSIHTVSKAIASCTDSAADVFILDYFAGSGTTAHAVVKLNREDADISKLGRRKFILAEIGEYFDTVLLPRIKKVIYAPDWKKGSPCRDEPTSCAINAVDRTPRLVKYHRIESYEDALDNIEFLESQPGSDATGRGRRYVWGWEGQASATFAPPELLEDPFNFKMPRAGKDAEGALADLPETFNYMAGVRLLRRRFEYRGKRRYQFDAGLQKNKPVVCVWRSTLGIKKDERARDRDFIKNAVASIAKEDSNFATATVFVNGSVAKYESLTPAFRNMMFVKK